MKSFEYDLRYIRAALDVLEEYLLSDEVFWPIGVNPPAGEPDYPRLTLGGMLLAKERLAAQAKTHPQEVQQVVSDIDRLRSKWRVAWEKKAVHCFEVRLRLWGNFIDEYQNNPTDNADRYAYEVRLRVMLQLLAKEGKPEQAELDLLSGMDKYLRSVLERDGFIWEAEIQGGFPEAVYWYLYGTLHAKGKNR